MHTKEVTGRHWPGSSPHVKRNGPQRPSPARSAIMAAAATSPASTPSATAAAPSAAVAAASDSASRRSRRSMIDCRTSAVNVAESGVWFSTSTSTSCTAVAVAAALEADPDEARHVHVRPVPSGDRVDGVVDRALHHRQVDGLHRCRHAGTRRRCVRRRVVECIERVLVPVEHGRLQARRLRPAAHQPRARRMPRLRARRCDQAGGPVAHASAACRDELSSRLPTRLRGVIMQRPRTFFQLSACHCTDLQHLWMIARSVTPKG